MKNEKFEQTLLTYVSILKALTEKKESGKKKGEKDKKSMVLCKFIFYFSFQCQIILYIVAHYGNIPAELYRGRTLEAMVC